MKRICVYCGGSTGSIDAGNPDNNISYHMCDVCIKMLKVAGKKSRLRKKRDRRTDKKYIREVD